MSMNLWSPDIDLWQTPTYIADICMSLNERGEPDGGMLGVKRRYIIWVKSSLNGVWKNSDDLASARESVKRHLGELNSIKNPTFGIV